MAVSVHPFAIHHAEDASGLAAILPNVQGARRIVLLAKIPGPAMLNDSCRELAQRVFRDALDGTPCPLLLSVGCEGIGSAGGWLLAEDGRTENGRAEGTEARLCFGLAATETIPESERGTDAQIATVAAAVTVAMAQAGLTPEQTALVLVKNPVRRSQEGATARARGAAALGAAIALGELAVARLDDPACFCGRAMALSGTEIDRAEVVVLGNRPGAGGSLLIGSRMLDDLLDLRSARRLLRELGASFDPEGVLSAALPLVLFKAGLRPDGLLRGRATHAYGTDMPADKHLRAAASGVMGALLGATDIFISGGAEHQGPAGACLLAAVAQA